MATPLSYPLEQVLDVKKKRVEDAEKEVTRKKKALELEKEKQRELERKRDEIIQHKQDKLNQLRETMDEGTTSPEILKMKAYIKIVDEKIVTAKKKVDDQKEQVEIAKQNLEAAKEELRQKRQEVDKLEYHKKEWMKDAELELERAEEREQDEIGSTMYNSRKLNMKKL